MSTLEQRIVDVIEAIASEFKKRDAVNKPSETTNSNIDEKTLARIMRCVHAWEKTQDTDDDELTDYDEYEVHNSNPEDGNSPHPPLAFDLKLETTDSRGTCALKIYKRGQQVLDAAAAGITCHRIRGTERVELPLNSYFDFGNRANGFYVMVHDNIYNRYRFSIEVSDGKHTLLKNYRVNGIFSGNKTIFSLIEI